MKIRKRKLTALRTGRRSFLYHCSSAYLKNAPYEVGIKFDYLRPERMVVAALCYGMAGL